MSLPLRRLATGHAEKKKAKRMPRKHLPHSGHAGRTSRKARHRSKRTSRVGQRAQRVHSSRRRQLHVCGPRRMKLLSTRSRPPPMRRRAQVLSLCVRPDGPAHAAIRAPLNRPHRRATGRRRQLALHLREAHGPRKTLCQVIPSQRCRTQLHAPASIRLAVPPRSSPRAQARRANQRRLLNVAETRTTTTTPRGTKNPRPLAPAARSAGTRRIPLRKRTPRPLPLASQRGQLGMRRVAERRLRRLMSAGMT